MNTSIGNVILENSNINSLRANTSTGNIKINNSDIVSGTTKTAVGNISVKQSKFEDTFGFYSSTGNITIEDSTYDASKVIKKTIGRIIER